MTLPRDPTPEEDLFEMVRELVRAKPASGGNTRTRSVAAAGSWSSGSSARSNGPIEAARSRAGERHEASQMPRLLEADQQTPRPAPGREARAQMAQATGAELRPPAGHEARQGSGPSAATRASEKKGGLSGGTGAELSGGRVMSTSNGRAALTISARALPGRIELSGELRLTTHAEAISGFAGLDSLMLAWQRTSLEHEHLERERSLQDPSDARAAYRASFGRGTPELASRQLRWQGHTLEQHLDAIERELPALLEDMCPARERDGHDWLA